MAQGRVDKRLLTKSAKGASARILLALAVAALLLAGCGGGSSDTSGSTTAASSATGEASVGSDSSGSGAGAGASAPAGKEASGTGGPDGPGGQSPPGGSSGPSVPPPKATPAPKATPQQRSEATVANMSLASPSSLPSTSGPPALPAQHTCDGRNTSPALSWQGVPQGTAELVLFAMNLQPVEGKLFFDWAVAGLSPGPGEIKAGELPSGAVVGRNSFGKTGYEICPAGGGETYMFTLFALPTKLSPAPGFDPLVLRKEVAGASGSVGLLALDYTRG